MSRDAFEHFLADRSRRGDAPAGSHSGAAGGAPCGDLVRISLALAGGRVEATRFDAEGCSATLAAGAAVSEELEGRTVLDAARLGPDDVANLLGGLSPQGHHAAELAADAVHRALSAAIASDAQLVPGSDHPARDPAAPGRESEEAAGIVLVAMSGGVDSAIAALLERGRGAEVIAVTLKLW